MNVEDGGQDVHEKFGRSNSNLSGVIQSAHFDTDNKQTHTLSKDSISLKTT